MTHRHILTCLFLLAIIPLSAKAFPPASPAGGNYLVLDGVDDYAVLDFKTFGILLPKGTNEFTVEAWVYPTTPLPDMDTPRNNSQPTGTNECRGRCRQIGGTLRRGI